MMLKGLLVRVEQKKGENYFSPEELVRKALEYYMKKLASKPTHCQVSAHSAMFDHIPEEGIEIDGVLIMRERRIQPTYYLVGIEMQKDIRNAK